MKRKHKIVFGVAAVSFTLVSSSIGFWLLGAIGEAYAFRVRFVLQFFLTFTPVFTTLAVMNLLKKEK